ncbi:hypothetical protein AB0E08_07495 [Streptomyces sp. NPDC048281]|uniref:hypothetical protein n=1 Tax=Streptomyces sp. NPDC048281 TaxID=3154715 RepID=UPI003419D4EE
MRYLCATYTPADGTTTTDYADDTAVLLITRAIGHRCTLTADADTAAITITTPDRTVTLTPAAPLPSWTTAQRREVLALAITPGPVVWKYGRTNVARIADGARWLTHSTTMALIRGGYLAEPGHGAPRLTLLAYLTIGTRRSDRPKAVRDDQLAAMLRTAYAPNPLTLTPQP